MHAAKASKDFERVWLGRKDGDESEHRYREWLKEGKSSRVHLS